MDKKENEQQFGVIQRLTGIDRGKVKGNFVHLQLDHPYDYKKPIVLCLDGNGNTNLKITNGFAKSLENTVGIQNEVDVLSVSYRLEGNGNATTGTLYKEDIEALVNFLFLPLISKDGKRLTVKKAKQNIKKITIFSYCYGVVILNKINKVLQERMLELGYAEDKIKQILKCLTNICYAPFTKNEFNTNLFIKSFDDDFFGEDYRSEAKEHVESLPKKEQDKYFVENFLYIGNGLVVNGRDFNLFAQNLRGSVLGVEDDHLIGSILKDANGNLLNEKDNIHSYTVSKCFTAIFRKVLENAILNLTQFTELDLEEIEADCKNIIDIANSNETEEIKRQVLKHSLTIVPIEKVLQMLRIKEKDIIFGRTDLKTIERQFVGRVDYSNTIYERIKRIGYINKSVGTREYTKKDIVAAEILPHDRGIITKDGNLIPLKKEDSFATINLAMMLQKIDPIGSIKYTVKKENGSYYIHISDNFGSRYVELKDTFRSLIKAWEDEYGDNNLTIELSAFQKSALKNLCTYFNVSTKNIVKNTELGIKK